MNFAPFALQKLVQEHPACSHVFLNRLTQAGVDSSVLQVFAIEYGVLRRGARVLDAHCPGAEARYREFQLSCGIRGQRTLEQALPGTRLAVAGLSALMKDLKRREGALWAIENVGIAWAKQWRQARPEPNRGVWDGYWREMAMGDLLIADPNPEAGGLNHWETGFTQALGCLTGFLDGCEAAINTIHAA
ncbi:MAG: hypothetical protein H8E15_11295 [Planctomycetes bacterium]|nr:hypothetical protein [Planctomycetota bacterium]